ncbi:hypothetical protein N658DRAFT_200838 [Parathielavia hyrcaniae]|uniref:Ubiquitin interaction domain-containing protein n=1 Tax=Parathielavia hyrcaniae TaxID=113614 RepID=A0AAN6T5U3_9PEZI|nr:hypothetical protein N658DRAFT_200838 [Parathielavia hyrcaniae]
MAYNGAPVSAEQVDMVMMITGFGDQAMIKNALQGNHGNVSNVINEYLDDAEKFRRKYGWDENAFAAGREGEGEGENTPGGTTNGPAFVVHPPVIYGTEPSSFFDTAPSRPPSRANNRSPMSRLVDVAAGEYTTDAPSNRQEEEDQLRRAINESLTASGVQSPQTFPPPQPPLPQQTGITTSPGLPPVQFGPANRLDYDPDEWAMIELKNKETDPDPTLRTRKAGAPVLLRCRLEKAWEKHRIGALLMIFQQIPAARNALLRSGEIPGYGYGNNGDWWQGQPILPPSQRAANGWLNDSAVSWSDEVHRLVAFLEATERSYGTADILPRASNLGGKETGDTEKDFFSNFAQLQPAEGPSENREALMSAVEIVAFDNGSQQGGDYFGLLDLQVNKEADPPADNLYGVMDWLFFADLKLAKEEPSAARMAWIAQPSDVFTCRLQGDDGLPGPLLIPETFFLDRYMKARGLEIHEIQMDMIDLWKAYYASQRKEDELIKWVNPQTNKTYDRRVLIKAAVRRCRERMGRISHRAFWREHEQAPADGEGEYYLPEHVGEPILLPEEASVVAHYKAKIQELEGQLAEMERIINEQAAPEKQTILEISSRLAQLLTKPSKEERWNPTYKYTLRGVVNDPNTVFLRIRGPAGEPEATVAEGGPPSAESGEERWWKVSVKTEDNTVEHTPVEHETVLREACGAGCQPIAVFATDKAMAQECVPLSEALKTFVKLDNRLFKQEMLQSSRMGHKRSAGLGDGSQSKRLQRSVSMDSMATNQASAGGSDNGMRDESLDADPIGIWSRGSPQPRDREAHDESRIPDLIDLHTPQPPPPAYENDVEMETGVSPALAQVTLQDLKRSSSPPAPEMQERPNALFVTRPNLSGSGAAPLANGTAADVEEPLIDLGEGSNGGFGARVNGL